MIRGMTILWTVLALCVGVGLFLLKYEVQSLEEKLAGLNRDIRHHQESIHILKAEWSYLNDPERLRELNERHLSLKAFRPDQIIAVADLPMAPPKSAAPQDAVPPAAEAPRTMVEAPQPAKPALAPKPVVKAMEAKAIAPAAPSVLKTPEAPKAPAKSLEAKPLEVRALETKPVESKPVVVAVTKPAVAAPRPAQTLPAMPVNAAVPQVMTQPAMAQPQPNVLVIKSPALLEAERGRR